MGYIYHIIIHHFPILSEWHVKSWAECTMQGDIQTTESQQMTVSIVLSQCQSVPAVSEYY